MRHYQPLAWAKWCRHAPDEGLLLEITFHFESSVIPFISRIRV
jgi:hypothetical protein